MMTYFITRHPGAVQWANAHNVSFDVHLEHLLSLDKLQSGDVVIGTLPINLISQINAMSVRYIHLSLQIPPELRGVELTVEQLKQCYATLKEFQVTKLADIASF